MKKEFVTYYGKAVIERDKLFIRTVDVPLSRSIFIQIIYPFAWLLIFVLQFFREDGPRKYVGILMWGFLMLFRLPDIYTVIFKRSFASRIPLHRIGSFTTEEKNSLQTDVVLHLKNGRNRRIPFRRLENQVEPFMDALTQYLAVPNFA